MNYFLVKTDPDTYSVDIMEKEKETRWDGVHNFQAIAVIKKMRPGDKIYLYHSQTDKSIVGLLEVSSEPFENTDDPRTSWAVNVRFIKRYVQQVTLNDFKTDPSMKDFTLVRNSRLSVMEVPLEVKKWIEERVK